MRFSGWGVSALPLFVLRRCTWSSQNMCRLDGKLLPNIPSLTSVAASSYRLVPGLFSTLAISASWTVVVSVTGNFSMS
jgi:hypothetical protein